MLQHSDGHPKSAASLREEETLAYWRENKIFEQTLLTPAGKDPRGEFVFLDGPPFANGLPHYGHAMATTLKDVFPRYKTMKGYRVPRVWGWDCHGLPVENLVEKELGLKVKKDIEEYGIEKFNEAARESVLRYAAEWRRIIPRIGRWVDMENDYKTMDPSFTESVWWGFKGLYDKGLVSEGYKAMHLCPRCETTLANFEVNQGYKDIADISVYVKFEIEDAPGTFIVAWTTTPWTLPGNVALAVGKEIDYVKVAHGGAHYIVAKERVADMFPEGAEVLEEMKGSALIGLRYKPLFDYYDSAKLENRENGWKIYDASFVTTEDGTGVVHIAPAFGEDDMALGREKNLPFIQHVEMNGKMKPEAKDFAGLQAKPKDDHQSTDVAVIKNLAARGFLLAKKKITHSYPHCWRCDTPLLNYAARSWFVNVPKIKDALIANNNQTEWVPGHMRDGRFGKWLEGARDWAISRSRFWGAPIPVWRCVSCEKITVAGSKKDVEKPAKNRYIIIRHGDAEHITKNVVSCDPAAPHHLTPQGKEESRAVGEELRGQGITRIVSSDFVRTKETARIVADVLGIPASHVEYEERFREVKLGVFNNRPVAEYRAAFKTHREKFDRAPEGGETLRELKERVARALWDLEEKYSGETILIVSHEYPLWLLTAAAQGLDARGAASLKEGAEDFIKTAEVRELSFAVFPHNKKGELDFHRPYIDEVELTCSCGGAQKRVPEVFDCWFESGSMPFAEVHHPFTGDAEKRIPADFIAEGPDQTRGWFYSLMVLSTALFDRPTFKNVVVNGLILAEDGQKMSKKLRNYPELEHILDRYGADALRLYMMGSPAVHAEDLHFSERGVDEVQKKIIMRFENALALYDLGRDGEMVRPTAASDAALDRWIVSRLSQLVLEIGDGLEKYEVDRAVRPIGLFVDDFSAWYLRRSRDRFKGEDAVDRLNALGTTRYVVEEFAKAIAPIAPFLAEHVWQHMTVGENAWQGSVHLAPWPMPGFVDEKLLDDMAVARKVVEQALAERAKAGIKVRQPLGLLKTRLSVSPELEQIIMDEVNVKRLAFEKDLPVDVGLDTTLTDELKAEGEVRDLIRAIQEKRKEMNLVPRDLVEVTVSGPQEKLDIFSRHTEEITKAVGAEKMNMTPGEQLSLSIHTV